MLEQELFDQAHTLQSTLLSMLDYALAEKDPQRARLLADTAVQAGEIFDLSDYAVLSAPFQLAAAEQDGPKALELLDRLLRSLTVPWDLSASPSTPIFRPRTQQRRARGLSFRSCWMVRPGTRTALPPGGARLAGAAGPVSDLKLTEISP